jgi:hypothetical protein
MTELVIFTKSDFAKAMGCARNTLSNWIKRKHLEVMPNGKINTKSDKNLLFITQKKIEGKYVFEFSNIFTKAKKPTKKKIIIDPEKIIEQKAKPNKGFSEPDFSNINESVEDAINLDKQKKLLDIERVKKQIELDELKIQKQKGELVPFDAVKDLIHRLVSINRAMQLQGVDRIIDIYISTFGGTLKDYSTIRKKTTSVVNDSCDNAIKSTILDLESLVEGIIEKRERGEGRE